MTEVTRRQFGRTAAAASPATAAGARRILGANERVRLGFIGLGNRGYCAPYTMPDARS